MDLLAGPRGRRLLLEFARWSEELVGDDALHSAVGHAELLFDPDPWPPVTRQATIFGDRAELGDGAPPNLPLTYGALPGGPHIVDWVPPREGADAAARDVAARLEAVPLADVSWETLSEPLLMMVGWARYWQPPDGTDVLLAAGPVRDALVRVAEHLAASPETAWWTSGVDEHAQWAMLWEGADPVPPMDSDRRRLAAARAHVVAWEERALREQPSDPRAAASGEWWSTPRRPPTGPFTTRAAPGGTPVGAWLVEDDFGWDEGEALRLDIPAGLRIFEIDSADAWAALCRRFPMEVTAQKRHDWYMTTARDGTWVMPDWAAVAEHYDAVHLQIGAYLTAAGTAIPVDDEAASVIAGWDPDATYWFTDLVRYVGERMRCVRRAVGQRQVWERQMRERGTD